MAGTPTPPEHDASRPVDETQSEKGPATGQAGKSGALLLVGGGALLGGGAAVAGAVVVLGLGLVAAGGAAAWLLYTPSPEHSAEAIVDEASQAPGESPEVRERAAATSSAGEETTGASSPGVDASRSASPSAPTTPSASSSASVGQARPSARRPAAPRPQVVKIITDPPAATVHIDGVVAGRTPLKTELEVGPHDIRIVTTKADSSFDVQVVESPESRFCYTVKGRKILAGC